MAVMSWTAELTRNCKWRLGEGYFGEVFVAVETKSGKCFAIKKVVNAEHNTARQEIAVLKRVNHPNIIKYHGYHIERGVFCLVLEYADMGTLRDKIRYPWGSSGPWGPWSEVDVWRFIENIAGALNFLHSMRPPILHRDLKPDNILGVEAPPGPRFTRRLISWKLADFGVAKMLTREDQKKYYGADTAAYMGPEVFRHFENYSRASDMWSFGCLIAFVMKKGNAVFKSKKDVLCYKNKGMEDLIFPGDYFVKEFSPALRRVVYGLLQVNSIYGEIECFTSLYFTEESKKATIR